MSSVEIRTLWKTASEQCELVWGLFTGYRVMLWVQGKLIVDELMDDIDSALRRAAELRVERTNHA
jgi:hypothetical protein